MKGRGRDSGPGRPAAELRRRGIRPRRALGQHFLFDTRILDGIVRAAQVRPEDHVLEIGAGTGTLTARLARAARRVTALELDPRLLEIARESVPFAEKVTFVLGDALAGKNALGPELRRVLSGPDLPGLLVANLPFNIATPLIVILVENHLAQLRGLTVTVQKEVAQRLASRPGDASYGAVTVLVGIRAEVKLYRPLPARIFWPPPEVDCAVIGIAPRPTDVDPEIYERVKGILHFLFGRRRKRVRAQLASRVAGWRDRVGAACDRAGIKPGDRPDHIGPEGYVELARGMPPEAVSLLG